MAILLFIIILFILIVVHEFGHFFTAKLFKMRVDEFGLGYPPRAKTLFIKGGTRYTLNWLPFGGFVKIFGEDGQTEKDPSSFTHKAWWKQSIVLLAGVTMNFILAWVLISIGFMAGMPASADQQSPYSAYVKDPHIVIQEVTENSPAKEAGLESGDTINYVALSDAKPIEKTKSIEDVRALIKESNGKPLVVGVEKNGIAKEITVLPKKNENNVYALGIAMEYVGNLSLPFFKAIGYSFTTSLNFLGQIIVAFGKLIHDSFLGKADLSSLTGPVGIVGIVGAAYQFGWLNLLFLTAMISLNLVVINLIPFPALDGGRLLFVFIEALTRKKIPAKVAGIINTIGFIFLILLMVFVTYRDITKLIVK